MVVAKFATTTQHGAIEGKTQTHMTEYYNLDVIISVGYCVKSQRGIEFRRWANKVLKDYIIKGYAINDKRLEGRDRWAGKKLVYLYRRLHYYCECQQLYNYYSTQRKEIVRMEDWKQPHLFGVSLGTQI